MANNLTPELKSYKEELEFLHKKIAELEWKIATINYGRKAVLSSEFEMLEDQLENYIASIEILLERIRHEVSKFNKSKQHDKL